MKKIFTFLAAIMMATFVFAGGGIFEAWMTVGVNGGELKPYKVNDGISLGVTKSGTIDSVFVKVWKNNGTDIQEVYMGYRIDEGEDKELKLKFGKDLGGNDQEWNNAVKLDLVKDISAGNHTIALWFKAKTNKVDCEEYIYMSNDGKNYLLTYSIGAMFAKNNWDAPKDQWTWKAMTEVAKDTFVLEKVVFGGEGLNISAEGKDAGSKWFGLKEMTYAGDSIQAEDTVKFVYAIDGTDTTLTATLLARPCKNQFGILVNGEYQAAVVNPEHKEGVEYMIKNIILKENDSIQMFDNCAKAAWVITDYMSGSYQFQVVNNKYVVSDSDKYDLYFQLGPDKLYVKKYTPVYYITGNEALVGTEKVWQPDAVKMNSGSYTFEKLPVGRYQMVVTNGTWEMKLGYDSLNTAASSENITGSADGNICFLVDSMTDVVVSVEANRVTVVGKFAEPCDGEYGIMVNGKFIKADVNPEVTTAVEYIIKDVALNVKDSVQMYDNCIKVAWLIHNYMEDSYVFGTTEDFNYYLVSEGGEYDFRFRLGSPDLLYIYKHYVPTPDFGIKVNGVYRPGDATTIEGGMQYRVDAVLGEGDTVRFYDNLNEKDLTLSLDPAGYTGFTMSGADMIVKEKGEYKFFIKIMDVTSQSNVLVEYKATAGLDDMMGDKEQCVKMVVNGQLVIVRDGVCYTPMGVRVK